MKQKLFLLKALDISVQDAEFINFWEKFTNKKLKFDDAANYYKTICKFITTG